MAESVGYRLGRWFGRLSLAQQALVVLGVILAVTLLFTALISGGDNTQNAAPAAANTASQPSISSCTVLSQASVNKVVSSWTGSGAVNVISARKAPSDGSSTFTEAWFIKASAPGISSEVFIFANDPGGLLVGADNVTREFFDWGAAISSSSSMGQDATATVRAAPECLS